MRRFAKLSFAALGCLGTLAVAVAAGAWLLWRQMEKAVGVYAYGEKDWLVPVGHAQRLEAACDSLGLTCRSFRFPHTDHLLASDLGQQQAFGRCVQAYARRYFGH